MHCAALALAIGLLPLTPGLGASATQSVRGTEAHLAPSRAPHPALSPPVHQRRHLSLRGGRGAGGARGGTWRMSMVGHPVATSAAVIGAANLLGLGITLSTRTNYHTDLLGTGSFVLAAWCTKGVDSLQVRQPPPYPPGAPDRPTPHPYPPSPPSPLPPLTPLRLTPYPPPPLPPRHPPLAPLGGSHRRVGGEARLLPLHPCAPPSRHAP